MTISKIHNRMKKLVGKELYMSKKELILDQLELSRNSESWIKPLSMALEDLSIEEIVWKQNEATHSILEIVNHLYFYNERWLKRFKGELPTEMIESNASTFFEFDNVSKDDWQNLVKRLDENLANWQEVIKKSEESKLHEQIPAFPVDAVWWGALSNLCTHNTYHIGQIIHIRKAQGSWKVKEE